MSKRKYSKCVRCNRTIDITNQDRDLCNPCAAVVPVFIKPTEINKVVTNEYFAESFNTNVNLVKYLREEMNKSINPEMAHKDIFIELSMFNTLLELNPPQDIRDIQKLEHISKILANCICDDCAERLYDDASNVNIWVQLMQDTIHNCSTCDGPCDDARLTEFDIDAGDECIESLSEEEWQEMKQESKEEDRLYLKSLHTDLTEKEERIMCSGGTY